MNQVQKQAGYDIATDSGALRYCRIHAAYFAGDMDIDFEDIRALHEKRLQRSADVFRTPEDAIAMVVYLLTEHTLAWCPGCSAQLRGMLAEDTRQ